MKSDCPDRRSRSSGTLPETLARNGSRVPSGCESKIASRQSGANPNSSALDAALDGAGRLAAACVTVEGEPGIGKTPPAGGAARPRGGPRPPRARGPAAEFERDLPFSVLVDALDAYVASQELELDAAPDADSSDELAGVLPSLRGARGDGARSRDERYRAHRAVRSLLELLAASSRS